MLADPTAGNVEGEKAQLPKPDASDPPNTPISQPEHSRGTLDMDELVQLLVKHVCVREYPSIGPIDQPIGSTGFPDSKLERIRWGEITQQRGKLLALQTERKKLLET